MTRMIPPTAAGQKNDLLDRYGIDPDIEPQRLADAIVAAERARCVAEVRRLADETGDEVSSVALFLASETLKSEEDLLKSLAASESGDDRERLAGMLGASFVGPDERTPTGTPTRLVGGPTVTVPWDGWCDLHGEAFDEQAQELVDRREVFTYHDEQLVRRAFSEGIDAGIAAERARWEGPVRVLLDIREAAMMDPAPDLDTHTDALWEAIDALAAIESTDEAR